MGYSKNKCANHSLLSFISIASPLGPTFISRHQSFDHYWHELAWRKSDLARKCCSVNDWRMSVGVAMFSLSPLDFLSAAQSCCYCVSRHFLHRATVFKASKRLSVVVRGGTRWGKYFAVSMFWWIIFKLGSCWCDAGENITLKSWEFSGYLAW